MNLIWLSICIPLFIGLASLALPKKLFKLGGFFAALSSVCVMAGIMQVFPQYRFESYGGLLSLRGDTLSLGLSFVTGLFGFLVALYSIGNMKKTHGSYWSLYNILLSSSVIVFLAGKPLILLAGWGVTGLVLALMLFQAGLSAIAKKTFIIVGGSDAFMILGLAALIVSSGSGNLWDIRVQLSGTLNWVAFIGLLIAALTKAGAMPFHVWIPETSRHAPIAVVAILPASLDKLLGIYLLKLVAVDWFEMSPAGNTLLMAIGAVTVVAAVFMALAQHNLKKLLGYHAVSQVGYMVIGIGTGNVIGIAGGLLHMLNHAIYKQALFLGAGVIEKRMGTTKLEELGGLFKNFPITFASFSISAMAISGIPLMNGFVSKWLVYQGVVRSADTAGPLWVLWLVSAIFGSALTLASFVKIMHAAFLGQNARGIVREREKLGWELPALIVLPLLCLLIGIFPHQTVYAPLGNILGDISVPGLWQPHIAAALLLIGILLCVVIYFVFGTGNYRVSETYIGGEKVEPAMRVSGVEFYTTIENLRPLKNIYGLAKKSYFDIYEQLKKGVFYCIDIFRWLHNGVLSVYVIWVVVGSVIIMYAILK